MAVKNPPGPKMPDPNQSPDPPSPSAVRMPVPEAIAPPPDVTSTTPPRNRRGGVNKWRQEQWSKPETLDAVEMHLRGRKGPVRQWRQWFARVNTDPHLLLDDPEFDRQFMTNMQRLGTTPILAINRMGIRGDRLWARIEEWADDEESSHYEIANYYVTMALQFFAQQMDRVDELMEQIAEDGAETGQIAALDRMIDRLLPEYSRHRTAAAKAAERRMGLEEKPSQQNHLHLYGPDALKTARALREDGKTPEELAEQRALIEDEGARRNEQIVEAAIE